MRFFSPFLTYFTLYDKLHVHFRLCKWPYFECTPLLDLTLQSPWFYNMDDFCSCFLITLWAPTSLFCSIPATSNIWVCSNLNISLAELTISFKSAFRSQLGSIFASQEEKSDLNRTSAQSRSFPYKLQDLGRGIWSQHFRAEGPSEPVNLVWQIRKLNPEIWICPRPHSVLDTSPQLENWFPDTLSRAFAITPCVTYRES